MSTKSTLPPYSSSSSSLYPTDTKRTSTSSASTISSAPTYTERTSFNPSQIFQINTTGKHSSDFHCFPRETNIPITVSAPNNSHLELFRNIRTNNYKGNCDLYFNNFDAGSNEKRADMARALAAQTTYRFMPGKHATIKFFSLSSSSPQETLIEEFEIRSKCLSNAILFTSPRFGRFIWRYSSRKERKAFAAENVDSLLFLERYLGENDKERVLVARLIRGEGTRTVGSSRWNSEGNGGRLEVDFAGLGGSGKGEREMEALVLSTILVVLKREIDNLGASQAVAL